MQAFAAAGADVIVAIGGGSPIDTAKGIGIVTTNPDFADVKSLEGVAATKNKSIPIIAVPTTRITSYNVCYTKLLRIVSSEEKPIRSLTLGLE